MECIWHRYERLPTQWKNERLICARVVDVIDEPEILQDFERVCRVTHPIGIPADWLKPGDSFNGFYVILDESLFLRLRQKIGRAPDPSVCSRFVASPHDLRGEIGSFSNCLADHERGNLNLVTVKQI